MRAGGLAGPPGAAVVVGGGFVGLSAALALQRAGAGHVRLLERAPGDPRRAASHGNAGTFAPYANVPVNAPGAAAAALAMLARPEGGPLSVRLTPHLLRMVPWALGFLRHSDPGRWQASGLALGSLLRRASEGYDGVLAQAGVDLDAPMGAYASAGTEGGGASGGAAALPFAAREGYLLLQKDEKAMRGSVDGAALRREGLGEGLRMESIGPAAVRDLEPQLDTDRHAAGGAWFFPDGWFLREPSALLRAMRAGFERAGGEVVAGEATGFVDPTHGHVSGRKANVGVTTAEAGEILWADVAVVAAGAHSAPLVRSAGDWVPLDTERGHSVEWAPGSEDLLNRAVCSPAHGFIVSPMSGGLRAAGLVELGGTEAGITAARCEQLERDTRSLLGVAGGATASGSKLLAPFWPLGPRDQERDWLGFRPTLPDALPVIGRSSKSPHVLYAFGHQHVGWTLGGITGLLVAELACGQEPSTDLRPFRPGRFSRFGWSNY